MVSLLSPELRLILAPLIGALAFGSLMLFVSWERERRRRARVLRQLRALSVTPGKARPSGQQLLRPAEVPTARILRLLLRGLPTLRNVNRSLEQAGLAWSSAFAAQLTLGAAVLGFGFGLVAGGSAAAAVGAPAGASLPHLYILHRKRKRIRAFEEQLPEAIDLLSRAIRAGHSVPTALRMVGEEGRDPVATEFRRVFEEQKYGLPFDDSLAALAQRVDLVDVRVMVVAILVQRDVGGNLTEVLDNISQLIRARFTLRRQLRVYTAQGKMSGVILGALPLAVAAFMYMANPEYVLILVDDPAGRLLLGAGITLQLLGYFWIWRILQVEL